MFTFYSNLLFTSLDLKLNHKRVCDKVAAFIKENEHDDLENLAFKVFKEKSKAEIMQKSLDSYNLTAEDIPELLGSLNGK